ncbi:MAG: YmdB family metallophosphoesterase [Spirochaetales bacterium]|nr:YmdB family metallophosphoesterase [Candidatus Physcosoma equi]
MIRILFLGELVGRCGIAALKNGLASVKTKYDVDYTVINGEGMTNGYGLGKMHSMQLGKLGIDLTMGGEKLFYKPDMVEFMPKCSFVLRPLNYPPQCPGKSIKNVNIKGRQLLFINLQGNADFRQALQNAFVSIDGFLRKVEGDPIILLEFHASTTAEKATMLHFLDGRVGAVIGTHTKIISADERVTENGTAFISDIGRVGSYMSVGGFDPDTEIQKYRSQIPTRSREAWDDARIQGVVVELDETTGKAVGIQIVDEKVAVRRPEENNG